MNSSKSDFVTIIISSVKNSSGLSVEDDEEEEILEESQLEDMREDAINIFRYHFGETSRKKINIKEEVIADLRQKIFRSRPKAHWYLSIYLLCISFVTSLIFLLSHF